MPMIRARYPKDWDMIAFQVKAEAQWCCEQCCRPCCCPGESVEDFLKRCQPWQASFTVLASLAAVGANRPGSSRFWH